jgi:hypothetical protein
MKFAAIACTTPVVAALLLCGACSSQMQRSAPLNKNYLESLSRGKQGVTGMPYFLPDTVVPITVSGDFVLLPERAPKKENVSEIDFEYVLTVSVGTPKQVADPNAALMLEYRPEAGSNDTFKLSVGANGLLSTVNSTSEDQSAAIILKLAELVKEAARTGAALGALGEKIQLVKPDADDARRAACFRALQKMSVTTDVNLSDVLLDERKRRGQTSALLDTQKDTLNANILNAMQKPSTSQTNPGNGPIVGIRLPSKGGQALEGTTIDTNHLDDPKADAYSGIVFRMMAPRSFGVDASPSGLTFAGGCELRSVSSYLGGTTIMVADPTRTFVVDNSRTPFVKKKINLTVTDGVLQGIDVEKPSELLAAISLPVDVLKVIASIPGEILSVKVKQLSDQNNLSAAQVKMLELQIDMIKQRQALIDAQNGTTK